MTGELSETVVSRPCAGVGGSIEQPASPTGSRRRARTSRRCSPPRRAGRIDELPEVLGMTLALVRDAARGVHRPRSARAMGADKDDPERRGPAQGGVHRAGRDARHRRSGCWTRSATPRRSTGPRWSGWTAVRRARGRRLLRVAPLTVGGMLREQLFGRPHGDPHLGHARAGRLVRRLARQWGLPASRARPSEGDGDEEPLAGPALDVGSPFDHARSGILYVARHLPQPGPGRPARGLPRRDHRADRGGRRPHARPVLLDARGQAGRRGAARAARRAAAVPGRRRHGAAGQAVRRGRRRPACSARCRCGRAWTCRGRRCGWWSSTASRSRARTTRSPRRGSAHVAAQGRQRVHGRRRDPRRAAARPGRRAAAAHA